jgi:hypothetical protein
MLAGERADLDHKLQKNVFSPEHVVGKQFTEVENTSDFLRGLLKGGSFLDAATFSFVVMMGRRGEKIGEQFKVLKDQDGQIFLQTTKKNGDLIEVVDLHGNFVSKVQKLQNGNVRMETKFHNGDGAMPRVVNESDSNRVMISKEINDWIEEAGFTKRKSRKEYYNFAGVVVREDEVEQKANNIMLNEKTTRRDLVDGSKIIVMNEMLNVIFSQGKRREVRQTNYYSTDREFDKVVKMTEYSGQGVAHFTSDMILSETTVRNYKPSEGFSSRKLVDKQIVKYNGQGEQESTDSYKGQVVNARYVWTEHNGKTIPVPISG